MTDTAEHGGSVDPRVARAASSVLRELTALVPETTLPGLEVLSTVRARRSRFVPCSDGPVVLTLARPEDLELVPALTEGSSGWDGAAAWARTRAAAEVRDRAVLLGLACAVPGEAAGADAPWVVGVERPGTPVPAPRVVDLSSLWAGPLCGHLLGLLGARVVAVEDPARPARRVYAAPETVSLSFRTDAARLRELIHTADVVIEASRPRALRALGLDPETVLADHDVTWVSITGYGRDQPDRIGYGDDAAAAAGLYAAGPTFAGDAVADPLTGLHAALAAWRGTQAGGARLLDVSLARVASYVAGS